MSEASNPFEHSELSPEDLEVVRAFHATDSFAVFQGDHEGEQGDRGDQGDREGRPYNIRADATVEIEDEMLVIFVSEVGEDIAALRHALEQAEIDDRIDSPGFLTLQRVAHKIRGTAAAIGCEAMSVIAHHIEMLIQQMKKGEILLLSGLFALGNAVDGLEMTLHSVAARGEEDMQPLLNLEEYYAALDIHTPARSSGDIGEDAINRVPTEQDAEVISQGVGRPQGSESRRPYPVDRQHLGQLIQHAEQLVEQQTALEVARKQVETAIQELHVAQARLRRVEAFFATLPMSLEDVNRLYVEYDEHPASSLVARILREAELRTGHRHQASAPMRLTNNAGAINLTPTARRKEKPGVAPQQPLPPPLFAEAAIWDELELDRFTESNLLTHALNEAIADVSTATAQLQHALGQLDTLVKQHMAKAQVVRATTLLLRTAPFSTLSSNAQKAVQKAAWKLEVQFEVTGETVEIDQDILETLETPLLQLIHAHLVEAIGSEEGQRSPCSIRLHAQTISSEVIIEIGFSLPIPGGFLDMLQEVIQPLHGSITAQRNATGGLDFRLRFPHAKGVAQGLLIRAGDQRVIVPFSQVQRIDYAKQEVHEQSYTLNALLGFARMTQMSAAFKDASGLKRAPQAPLRSSTSPVLVLQADTPVTTPIVVQVDEVVGQIELVMKPPPAPLRRPGITGMAIDSTGNVLLVLDVPELIRQSGSRGRDSFHTGDHTLQPETLIRQSGLRELDRADYEDAIYRVPTEQGERTGNEQAALLQLPERGKPKILIADDSVTIRRSLSQTLSQKDYLILEARDGLEALELLAEESPDLLLLDLEMPNMNGYEVLNILRTRAMLPQLRIILLTSRASEKHKRRAHELGIHTYLTKPCPDEELLETVGSLLAKI